MNSLNFSKESRPAGRAAVSEVVKQRGQERLQKFAGSTWAMTGCPSGFEGNRYWFSPARKKFPIFFGASPSTSNGIRSNLNFSRRRKMRSGSSGTTSLSLKIFISWPAGIPGIEPRAEVSAYQFLELQDILMVNAFQLSSCFPLLFGLGVEPGLQPVPPFDPSVLLQQELADTPDQALQSSRLLKEAVDPLRPGNAGTLISHAGIRDIGRIDAQEPVDVLAERERIFLQIIEQANLDLGKIFQIGFDSLKIEPGVPIQPDMPPAVRLPLVLLSQALLKGQELPVFADEKCISRERPFHRIPKRDDDPGIPQVLLNMGNDLLGMRGVSRPAPPDVLAFPALFKEPAVFLEIFIVLSPLVSDAVFRNRPELGQEEAGLLDPAHEDFRVFFQVMVKGGCAAPAHPDDQEIRPPP